MNTITTYSARELKEQFPDAFERVLDKWKEYCYEDIFWMEEIVGSMKKVFAVADIRLNDWSLGAYSPCYVKFDKDEFGHTEKDDEDINNWSLEGKKALNWVKEQFSIKSVKRVNYKYEGKKKHRYDIIMKDGKEFDCPFTGYCADYDYMYAILDNIHSGMDLNDTFHDLADVCGKLIEQEIEGQSSEEYFLDHAEANKFSYTENGTRV